MSAEILRRAAALMCERAEAATPGPWRVHDDPNYQVGYARRDGEFDPTPMARVTGYGGTVFPWDAEHIASWDPAVALAVADALDQAAAILDGAHDGPLEMAMRAIAEPIVTVARAYLEEPA